MVYITITIVDLPNKSDYSESISTECAIIIISIESNVRTFNSK